jgi:hypothetical protein
LESFIRIEFLSFPEILGGVAYPVEPLGFEFISNRLPPPLLDGIRDRLGKEPKLLDQLADSQANELQYVHVFVFIRSFSFMRSGRSSFNSPPSAQS